MKYHAPGGGPTLEESREEVRRELATIKREILDAVEPFVEPLLRGLAWLIERIRRWRAT